MHREELQGALSSLFEPEPDEDGFYCPAPPHSNLKAIHGLDASYWEPYEFGSMSPFSKLVKDAADPINRVTQSLSAPNELFWAGLRLFRDSLIEYCDAKEPRSGPLQYYPPILMTFWAAFEAFVHLYSEVLALAKPTVPAAVKQALLEVEDYVGRDGEVLTRPRQRPVLDRYWLLLRYGYGLDYDRGNKIWQAGQAALAKRNGLVHYEVSSAPSLVTLELWTHLEAILLLLVGPSTELKKSVYSHQFEVHWVLSEMRPLIVDFEEKTLFKGKMSGGYLFPCSFDGIPEERYPPGSNLRSWGSGKDSR